MPVLALVSDQFSAHDALDRGATECMVNLRTTPGDLNRKVGELLGERAGSQPGAPTT